MLANVLRSYSRYFASVSHINTYLYSSSPVSRGICIVPSGIAAYLMRRCCFWECFCGLMHDRPTPVWFVTSAIGHTKAVCHFRDHHCRFSSMFVIFAASYNLLHYSQSTLMRHVIQHCLNHHMMTSQHKVKFHLMWKARISSIPSSRRHP